MLLSEYTFLYIYFLGGTDYMVSNCFHVTGSSLLIVSLLLDRVFQEYENLIDTLENNRNYLSDSFGDFLFNNDEYLWTPIRTYYKKKLL